MVNNEQMLFNDVLTNDSDSSNVKILEVIPTKIFSALLDILDIFKDNENGIIINDSEICQTNGFIKIKIDLTPLLSRKINLHINNPSKRLKLLRDLTKLDGNNIFIKEQGSESNKIIITNESEVLTIELPKEFTTNQLSITDWPNLDSFESITDTNRPLVLIHKLIKTKNQDKNSDDSITADNIKKIIKDAGLDFVNIVIDNDKIIGLVIPDHVSIKFENLDGNDLTKMDVDVVLQSRAFLQIEGNRYAFYIKRNSSTDCYYLYTIIDTGIQIDNTNENKLSVYIHCCEEVSETSNETLPC
jgi:hypothetical protein